MDAQTIDEEFDKLKTEFRDVAATVTSLSEKLMVAKAAGDANAAEWLDDLKKIARDIDDEQLQAHTLLHTIHRFITNVAETQTPTQPDEKPPLFAPGQEPDADEQQARSPQRHGLFGGMGGGMMSGGIMGGGMMGGGMMGGYGGGGFGRAMEMGMGMSLGANLMRGIFR